LPASVQTSVQNQIGHSNRTYKMYYHPRRRQRDANIASEAFAKVTGWREKINRTGNEDDITHGNEDDITHGNDDGASNGDDSESHYDAGKYDIWVLYYCTIP